MPFWRKSEDPWDMEPEKRRTWTAGEPQPPAADHVAPPDSAMGEPPAGAGGQGDGGAGGGERDPPAM